ncbi:hypothetical protein Tco_0660296, partial [Tanacetum coccineum]
VNSPDSVELTWSTRLTLSSTEYGNPFINENPDVSLTDVLKDPAENKIQSMVDVPIHQEDLTVQRPPLVDTIGHSEPINKYVQAHLKKVFPTTALDFDKLKQEKVAIQSMPKYSTKPFHEASLNEYDQKNKLMKLMMKSNKDKEASSKEVKASSKSSKIDKVVDAKETVHDDAMDVEARIKDDFVDTQEPTQDDAAPKQDRSKWFKQDVVERPETPNTKWYKEPNTDDAPEQNWFNKMVNAKKDPIMFDDLIGSTIDFTKNYIELDYNIEQCYLALIDQIDWADPEGDRCPYDLIKPIPLHGHPGRTTIPVDFFFNKDLDSSKVRYDLNASLEIHQWGTKCQLFYKAQHVVTLSHTVYSRMKILSIIRILVDKQFGYGYLKEIVVRRQTRKSDEQVDLVTALHLFIRRIILKKRVEDIQLGVESYQTKLNITRPQVRCGDLDVKETYTILQKPRGVVYLNKNNGKYLMRDDELYKFSDGTLKPVYDILNSILHNFMLGFNNASMPKRAWTEKDQKRTTSMLKKIDATLLERRIMRSLECFVGGRRIDMDYKLLTRTK